MPVGGRQRQAGLDAARDSDLCSAQKNPEPGAPLLCAHPLTPATGLGSEQRHHSPFRTKAAPRQSIRASSAYMGSNAEVSVQRNGCALPFVCTPEDKRHERAG